jgi:uncharacterized protein YutE (UPF0331/DUF86 family)
VTAEQVQSKLDVLKANLEKLDQIPQESFELFASDFRNVESALHLLQTSIQALIDLGALLLAREALPTPKTSAEVFLHLERAGRLPAGSAGRMLPIIGFRNRVVHLYDRIDERRVYEILTEHRQELTELLDLLLDATERSSADQK